MLRNQESSTASEWSETEIRRRRSRWLMENKAIQTREEERRQSLVEARSRGNEISKSNVEKLRRKKRFSIAEITSLQSAGTESAKSQSETRSLEKVLDQEAKDEDHGSAVQRGREQGNKFSKINMNIHKTESFIWKDIAKSYSNLQKPNVVEYIKNGEPKDIFD